MDDNPYWWLPLYFFLGVAAGTFGTLAALSLAGMLCGG